MILELLRVRWQLKRKYYSEEKIIVVSTEDPTTMQLLNAVLCKLSDQKTAFWYLIEKRKHIRA